MHPSTSLGDCEIPEESKAEPCTSVSPTANTRPSVEEMKFLGQKTEMGHQEEEADLLGPGGGRMNVGGAGLEKEPCSHW